MRIEVQVSNHIDLTLTVALRLSRRATIWLGTLVASVGGSGVGWLILRR
ncbi:hypothetical protein [Streptomyces sp. GS7]|nr:hypothetical protein [Streptomyces sp. GS7]QHC23548.1 hypothetical protein GR130_21415 [Streptomyces sp. GS7]